VTEAAGRFVRSGISLHVDDAGGPGLPVLFQHGLCGDAGQTREAFPADAAFRRLTVECRGHGRSGAGDPSRFSIGTFADDVAAFIEATGRTPLVVGGISMGAAIALRLAVVRPELVRGLILARPAWVTDAAPENMAPNAEVGRLLAALPADAAQRTYLASDMARRLAEAAPDNLASLNGFFTREPLPITAALLQAISKDGPGVSTRDLRALRVPTLVIGHRRDAIHPFAHAETLASLIPAARLVTITAKADDRARYVDDFRQALSRFLGDFV
jgi:pimeloyl-ACP methyl ester carboxylesterase